MLTLETRVHEFKLDCSASGCSNENLKLIINTIHLAFGSWVKVVLNITCSMMRSCVLCDWHQETFGAMAVFFNGDGFIGRRKMQGGSLFDYSVEIFCNDDNNISKTDVRCFVRLNPSSEFNWKYLVLVFSYAMRRSKYFHLILYSFKIVYSSFFGLKYFENCIWGSAENVKNEKQ